MRTAESYACNYRFRSLSASECENRALSSHTMCPTIGRMAAAAAEDRVLSPFARRVAELRNLRGYSQQMVATAGGFSPGYIGSIESGDRGRRPSRDMVLKIARGLRATDQETDELLRLAGYLTADAVPDRLSFAEVVNTDPRLRSDQRKILIDLYATFTGRRQ